VTISKNDGRKQQDRTESKCPVINPLTEVSELLDCSSTEISTTSQINSPLNVQVKSVTPKVTLDTSKNCFICLKILEKTDLIGCLICSIKGNNDCNR